MKRLLFLANSFHLTKTRSSLFFSDWLSRHFELTIAPHKKAWLFLRQRSWDLVVCWQHLYSQRELEAFGCRNIILVPMYDDCPKDKKFWEAYQKWKILCFCQALNDLVLQSGCQSFWLHYYPEIPQEAASALADKAFFWERTNALTWKTIQQLCGIAAPKHLHLHLAGDPGYHPPVPSKESGINLTTTRWLDSPNQVHEILKKCSVYFAPRLSEGLGMSFLEAMALGLCVVAPHRPTMNEYIQDGVNGLLYDPENPQPLNFTQHRKLGARARGDCEKGRPRWLASLPFALDFLLLEPKGVVRHRFLYRFYKIMLAGLWNKVRKLKGFFFQ